MPFRSPSILRFRSSGFLGGAAIFVLGLTGAAASAPSSPIPSAASLASILDRAETLEAERGSISDAVEMGPLRVEKPGTEPPGGTAIAGQAPVRSGDPRTLLLPRPGAERGYEAEAGVRGEGPVGERGGATTTWAPYTGEFGVAEAAHLLHRTVVGPTWTEIEAAVARGLEPTVDLLFQSQFPPVPPGPWATEPIPDVSGWSQAMIDSLVNLYRVRDEILRVWWPEVVIDAPLGLRETMTHFWHDHFATGVEKVLFPQSMYVQNALLRQHALGNFKDLTLAVSLDPAMLLWLDNQVNYSGSINENFARELLELFTLGVGHYTQNDIVQTARAFTGYLTLDGVTSTFIPDLHDYGYKVILGQGGYWYAEDVIEIVFQQDECARFLCRKLYRWFLDEYPDEALVEELAQTLRANDYEVEPVLRQILLSERFFDPDFRGSVISDGLDHYAGLLRTFGMGPQVDLSDYLSNQSTWVRYSMYSYNHVLLDPPNVAGWPGYRTWINSFTLPWRKQLGVALVDGQIYGWPLTMQMDAMAFAESLSDPMDAYQLIDDVAMLLFGMPPTELVRQRMLDELLQGAEPWEWSLYDPSGASRVRGLVRLALRLPDVQSK